MTTMKRNRADQSARARRNSWITGAIALLFAVVAVALVVWFVASRNASEQSQRQAIEQAQQAVSQMTRGEADEAIEKAQAYNQRLAEEGQTQLGSISDPYTAMKLHRVGEGARDDGQTEADVIAKDQGDAATKDAEYNGLLDSGGGIMGSVSIPKINVELPLYHGTSTSVLASGAGHLHGTSLPVGGASSHAVITAHRGLVTAQMFTRLDEMERGDDFSITVMGKTLNYRVDRVEVVEPDDIEPLKIVAGEDRVTLLTCTPYGVNTQRLLVSGVRIDDGSTSVSPDTKISSADSRIGSRNALVAALFVGGVVLFLGCLFLICSRAPDVTTSRHSAR